MLSVSMSCLRLPLALLAWTSLAARPSFTPRPDSFAPVFPNPAAFQQTQARRLQACDGKPPRLRFEFDEGGYDFSYEYAGDAEDVRVLDIDASPGVIGIACVAPQEADDFGNIWLRIDDGSLGAEATDPRALRVDDVITGGADWRCGIEAAGGFLQRIVAVEISGDEIAMTTRPVVPFEIFKNLYIDLSWTPSSLPGRRLAKHEKSTTYFWSTNYDNETKKAAENIPLGPLKCDSCYATVDATVQLTIETDGAVPKLIRLRVSGDMHAEISVGAGSSVQDLLGSVWQQISSVAGPDMLALAALNVPLFNLVNSATLNLKVTPTQKLAVRGDVTTQDLLQQERFKVTVDAPGSGTYFQVQWTPDAGYETSMDFTWTYDVQVPDQVKINRLLVLGLQSCLELMLTAGGSIEVLTSLQACPEVLAMLTQTKTERRLASTYSSRLAAAELLLAQSEQKLVNMCIDLQSFETNSYADWFDLDGPAEPFTKACFFGKCVQTGSQSRFGGRTTEGNCQCNQNLGRCGLNGKTQSWCYVGSACSSGQASTMPGFPNWAWCNPNKVTWMGGPRCITVPEHSISANQLTVHALEADPVFNDEYIYAKRVSVSGCATADGCTLALTDLELAPRYARVGTMAEVHLKVTIEDARRLSAETQHERVLESDQGAGSNVQLQLGVYSSFGGFKFPSFFNKGASTKVVDAVEGPSFKPKPVTLVFKPSPVEDTQVNRGTLTTPWQSWQLLGLLLLVFGVSRSST